MERFLLESLLLALFSRTPVPPFALSLPVHYRVLSLRDVRLVFFLVFGGGCWRCSSSSPPPGGGHSDARRARLSSGGCLQPPARLGFVEGDGHFGLSVPSASLEKARGNVSPRFSIDQKEKRGEVSNGGGHTYGTPAAAAIPMVRRGGGRQRALRASCARRRPERKRRELNPQGQDSPIT